MSWEFGPSSLHQNFVLSFICSSEKSTIMGEFLSTVTQRIKGVSSSSCMCSSADTGSVLHDSLAFDLMYLACLSFRGNEEAQSARIPPTAISTSWTASLCTLCFNCSSKLLQSALLSWNKRIFRFCIFMGLVSYKALISIKSILDKSKWYVLPINSLYYHHKPMVVWGVCMSISMMLHGIGSSTRWRLDVNYFSTGISNDFISFFLGGSCLHPCVIILPVMWNWIKIYSDSFVTVDTWR